MVLGIGPGHHPTTVIREWSSADIPVASSVAIPHPPGLDHPVRERIYGHLLTLPGDHFCSIVRSLGLGSGSGRHHLTVLVRKGLVTRDRTNGRVRFYLAGPASAEQVQLYRAHWEYRDLRQRALLAVRRMGAAGVSEVAQCLGISRQLAAYHLGELLAAGRLRRKGVRFAPP